MKQHKIGWLNVPGYIPETWNPIIGCNKVSPGCRNCFAARMAHRLMHMPHTDYYQFVLADNGEEDPEKFKNLPEWNGTTHLVKSHLAKPSIWTKPRAIFTVDMGDLFHESNSMEWINSIFAIMSDIDRHIYIVLTKRPERILEFIEWKRSVLGIKWQPTPNIWPGVTAENQEMADKRIPILLRVPAAKRFVSIEPMLGSIDLNRIPARSWGEKYESTGYNGIHLSALIGGKNTNTPWHLDWVIVGGETGPNARPMHPDWVRSIQKQCEESNTPFFFKQWGEYIPSYDAGYRSEEVGPRDMSFGEVWSIVNKCRVFDDDQCMVRVGRKAAGNLLDGKQYHAWPKIK